MIHEFLLEQQKERPELAKNLRVFAQKILNLINSKFSHQKIVFEVKK
jgi:hypothetical protein